MVTSALEEENVEAFVDAVVNYLPEGPLWFPADMETDQPQEVIVAEFIREKILRNFFDEVPHAIGVAVEEMEFEKPNLYRIYAVIYVERDSQKGIIIGKRGAARERSRSVRPDGTNGLADAAEPTGARPRTSKLSFAYLKYAQPLFGTIAGTCRPLAGFLGRTSNFVVAG